MFCQSLADTMNTSGKVRCKTSELDGGASSYEQPNFVTSDGVRFWGLEGYKWDQEGNQAREIYVDRQMSTDELKKVKTLRDQSGEGMKIRVWYDGKIDTGDSEDYDYVNELIETSLQVTNKKD